ncbi:uncharacterized protein LOC131843709 [Achroia grisella]|uniref:uncharacterized protein LOC131843709 n=1 Tax=Achroia grisella TaxID=688607 RepID=UPI0027D20B51|nr:uncharacterized protein LOC131843709 [Achroia grisella]
MSSNYDSDDDYYPQTTLMRYGSSVLPYNNASIEMLILDVAKKFDFRVVITEKIATDMIAVTTGLSEFGDVVGSALGYALGGKEGEQWGSVIGTIVGAACGVGLTAVAVTEIWNSIKSKLYKIFKIVYDYLASLRITDYSKAAMMLTQKGHLEDLAFVIMRAMSGALGQQVLSSLTAS